MPRLAKNTTYERDEDDEDGYVSILKRTRKDIAPPALIPSGVWKLRCVGAKQSKYHDEKNNRDIELFTLTHEPVEPYSDPESGRSSVDPDEAEAIDEKTGMSPFDGKRTFTKFYIRTQADADRLARVMDMHFDEAEDGEGSDIETDLQNMKSKLVLGEIYVNSWKDRNSNEPRSDSAVKNWARVEN